MTDPGTTRWAFAPPPAVSVPIEGDDRLFPVRRIYCVGRNYLAHIREMGGDEREPPFFFQKPADSIVLDGASAPYPPATADFQYEIELVIAIGEAGRDIAVEDAGRHVFGVAVGIDLTRRDLQLAARNSGRPWESGKSFDASAPISAIRPLPSGVLPTSGRIELRVNGETRQDGDLDQLIWSCAEVISQLSTLYELKPGDLIYTGTPAGVGPVDRGDTIHGSVAGVGEITISIAS
jgi:fumarylpyruvate hydrolase